MRKYFEFDFYYVGVLVENINLFQSRIIYLPIYSLDSSKHFSDDKAYHLKLSIGEKNTNKTIETKYY